MRTIMILLEKKLHCGYFIIYEVKLWHLIRFDPVLGQDQLGQDVMINTQYFTRVYSNMRAQ
jgi:hypothetical protein